MPIKGYSACNSGIFQGFCFILMPSFNQYALVMKTFYALFVCLLAGLPFLTAQSTAYDIGNYRARYERRPLLQLNTNLSFEGEYNSQFIGTNNGSFSFPVDWYLQSNTDKRILDWNFSGRTGALFGIEQGNSARYSSYFLRASASRTAYHYKSPGKFWGWGSTASIRGYLRTSDIHTDDLRLSISPSIFKGKGRLEYGQDALLANWMMKDLGDAGVISAYAPDQVEALAKTITDIIGNRTFDFRRRRIYELKRLQQTLFDNGLVEEESFDLFAILNDNWAFANRASLPYGNRFRYGLSGSLTSNNYYPVDEDALVRTSNSIRTGAFAEYINAKIVNNNGSSQWIFNMEGNYVDFERIDFDGELFRSGWQVESSVAYRRTWLPTSRMFFNWTTTVSWNHYFPNGNEMQQMHFDSFTRTYLFTGFNVEYFMNYQWTIDLQLGAFASYRYAIEENNITFRPDISIRSVYSFF